MSKKICLILVFLIPSFISFAQPNTEWVNGIGSIGVDHGKSVTTDSYGNVFVTGWFEGTADFLSGPGIYNISTAGNMDIFIAKFNSSGVIQWIKTIGGVATDKGYSIIVDDTGNVFTTGNFGGTVDFDPGPGVYNLSSPGSADVYISKLDSSGNFVWAKSIGGSNLEQSFTIVLDHIGNIYVGGSFGSMPADFDPGPGINNLSAIGLQDIFILKLDPAGNFLWAKATGGTETDNCFAITFDQNNNPIICGTYKGTVDFNPGIGVFNLTSIGGWFNGYIYKLDILGNFMWAKSLAVSSIENIVIDNLGNLIFTGNFENVIDFNPGAGTYNLNATGFTDTYVCKLNSAGNFIWVKNMGGSSYTTGLSLAIDTLSNLYISGHFENQTDFDPGPGI